MIVIQKKVFYYYNGNLYLLLTYTYQTQSKNYIFYKCTEI